MPFQPGTPFQPRTPFYPVTPLQPSTTDILPTDTLVFVVGPSYSGKSWLLRILLQIADIHIPVSEGQESGTTGVYVERCRFKGIQGNIILVDTPSFCTSTSTDGEATLQKWMTSHCVEPYKAVGILYTHNTTSDPFNANLELSKHLEAFGRTPRHFAPSAIHVVPTVAYEANFSTEGTTTLVTQLQRQADNIGVSMCKTLFDGRPEVA